jgi:hypothetical protein
MNKSILFSSLLFLLLGLFILPLRAMGADPTPAPTEEIKVDIPPLYLAEAKGEVYVVHDEVKDKADPPQALEAGDRILTKADSLAYLEFKNGGVVEVNPNSDFKVNEAQAETDFRGRFLLAFGKVMSMVHKLTTTHSAFEVEAGGVIAGVRGTVFSVEYNGYKCPVIEKTYEGSVSNRWVPKKEQTVDKDHWNRICTCGETTSGTLSSEEQKEFGRFKKAAEEIESKSGKVKIKLKEKLEEERREEIRRNRNIMTVIIGHYH